MHMAAAVIRGGSLTAKTFRRLLINTYVIPEKANPIDGFVLDWELSSALVPVYRHRATGQIVVSHCGAYMTKDFATSLCYLVGRQENTRFKHAFETQKRAEKKYGADKVTTIGHSLGGALAMEVGGDSREIITLNRLYRLQDRHVPQKPNQYDIRSSWDIVSIVKLLQKNASPNDLTVMSTTKDVMKEHAANVLKKLGDRRIGTSSQTRRPHLIVVRPKTKRMKIKAPMP